MNRNLPIAMCFATALYAQPAAPTFRSETRVVTVDVMIRDLATRLPADNLRRADFQLRIDGKERQISYFAHDRNDRRPLAMLVFFNLAPEGGLTELSKPDALESFRTALSRLTPKDEVAVFAIRDWFVGEAKEMTGLTRDRQAAAQAMQDSVATAAAAPDEERQAQRHSKDKTMAAAVQRAVEASTLRPDSQVALVYVSDGMNTLDTMEARKRHELAQLLQARNISFSALNLKMISSYAAAAAVINPLGVAFGLSVTGSGSYLAKQAGGVTVEVPSAREFGASLEQVVSSYASRYSLGYRLSEGEFQDGRVHRIAVRLIGDAAKGREVLSRRGFVAERK